MSYNLFEIREISGHAVARFAGQSYILVLFFDLHPEGVPYKRMREGILRKFSRLIIFDEFSGFLLQNNLR